MKRFLVQGRILRTRTKAPIKVAEFGTPCPLPKPDASLALRKPASLYN